MLHGYHECILQTTALECMRNLIQSDSTDYRRGIFLSFKKRSRLKLNVKTWRPGRRGRYIIVSSHSSPFASLYPLAHPGAVPPCISRHPHAFYRQLQLDTIKRSLFAHIIFSAKSLFDFQSGSKQPHQQLVPYAYACSFIYSGKYGHWACSFNSEIYICTLYKLGDEQAT